MWSLDDHTYWGSLIQPTKPRTCFDIVKMCCGQKLNQRSVEYLTESALPVLAKPMTDNFVHEPTAARPTTLRVLPARMNARVDSVEPVGWRVLQRRGSNDDCSFRWIRATSWAEQCGPLYFSKQSKN